MNADRNWTINRLGQKDRNDRDSLAHALPHLYDIDISAFPNEKDQYGLNLIQLALLQPEAFWLARIGSNGIGYFSVFILRTNRLYKDLDKKSSRGELDIPDLSGKYSQELANTYDRPAHIYIDALAVKDAKDMPTGFDEKQKIAIWRELISSAWNDLESLLFRDSTVCLVAVRRGIPRKIEGYGLGFTGSDRKANSPAPFRQLYVCTQINNTNDFRKIMAPIING